MLSVPVTRPLQSRTSIPRAPAASATVEYDTLLGRTVYDK